MKDKIIFVLIIYYFENNINGIYNKIFTPLLFILYIRAKCVCIFLSKLL